MSEGTAECEKTTKSVNWNTIGTHEGQVCNNHTHKLPTCLSVVTELMASRVPQGLQWRTSRCIVVAIPAWYSSSNFHKIRGRKMRHNPPGHTDRGVNDQCYCIRYHRQGDFKTQYHLPTNSNGIGICDTESFKVERREYNLQQRKYTHNIVM